MTETASAPSAIPARVTMRATPRTLVIGLIGFLTLVDLFAAQAILPSLVAHYAVSRAAMGLAVNASTFGMAAACLIVSLLGDRIDQRRGVAVSLAVLSIPTLLLAFAPDLATFTILRVCQGFCMASAFTLTMAYLADRAGPRDTASALAAYVTGVVASNLIGRLMAGSVNELAGLAANFYVFAALNIAGGALVAATLSPSMRANPKNRMKQAPLVAWVQHLGTASLRAAFAVGFLILFVFIGCFTYVNFELAQPPIALSPMHLGFVYLVFLPAMVTTPFAGRVAIRFGARRTVLVSLGLCIAALPFLLAMTLPSVLAGLTLMGVGTFFAQAAATGFVGRNAASDRAAASGLYLAAYYLGGLAGAFAIGRVYEAWGWSACVAGLGVALLLCGLAALGLRAREG
jgi:MFS transporter, YNFM family, putative membrane transport protein